MILLDKPFVSEFLKQTITRHRIPVINTPQLENFRLLGRPVIYPAETAIQHFKNGDSHRLYSNSENAIHWVVRHLAFTDLPRQINWLKNKGVFRQLLAERFPDFRFLVVDMADLDTVDVQSLRLPFIIKPAVGFFSMGVYKVSCADAWPGVVQAIRAEMKAVQSLYPAEVLDTAKFIIEDCIEGTELAVDLYYNATGEPVIVNIYQHLFASETDVSDRVYITSKAVTVRYKTQLEHLLADIGRLAGLKNFPVHAEVRLDSCGKAVPIEINPMRFGGWCAADIAHHAYQINPYRLYFDDTTPDWDKILAAKGPELTALIVLDMPKDVTAREVAAFDYPKLLARFEKPLELRRINYHEYPVFGFLFVETQPENVAELEAILQSDLKEFIQR